MKTWKGRMKSKSPVTPITTIKYFSKNSNNQIRHQVSANNCSNFINGTFYCRGLHENQDTVYTYNIAP